MAHLNITSPNIKRAAQFIELEVARDFGKRHECDRGAVYNQKIRSSLRVTHRPAPEIQRIKK